jgi:hypothetical protein
VSRIYFRFLQRPPQTLTRQSCVVPDAEVSVFGIDVDAICAESLGIASIFLFVFLGFGIRETMEKPGDPHENRGINQGQY